MTLKNIMAKATIAGALGFTALGLSAGLASGAAQAEPGFAPLYHWCPGDGWDPGWGFNWDWGHCHDDHHADYWGDDHSHDWWGDQGGGWDHDHDHDGGGPWQPWQPWQH